MEEYVLIENEHYCLMSVNAGCDGALMQYVWQACGYMIDWSSRHSSFCFCSAFEGQLRHPGRLQLGQSRLRQVLCSLVFHDNGSEAVGTADGAT